MIHSTDTRCQDDFEGSPQPFVAYLSFFRGSTVHAKPVSANRIDNPVVYEKCGKKEEQLYVTQLTTDWFITTVGVRRANNKQKNGACDALLLI